MSDTDPAIPTNDNTAVRVATINFKQGIAIAVITAIVTIFTVWYNGPKVDGPKKILQPFLQVKRVDFFMGQNINEPVSGGPPYFRLIIRVNGFSYSYPSSAIYQYSSGPVPPEVFALPISEAEYRVSFEAMAVFNPYQVAKPANEQGERSSVRVVPGNPIHSVHKSTKVDRISGMPYEGQYELHRVKTMLGDRETGVSMRIYYDVENR